MNVPHSLDNSSQLHPSPAGLTTPFSATETAALRQQDVSAAVFIGTMLTVLFAYSALVMGGVVYWTYLATR